MKKLKEKKGIKLIAGVLPLVMLFLFFAPNLNADDDECMDALIKCVVTHAAAAGSLAIGLQFIQAMAVAAKGAQFCTNGYWFCKRYWTKTK